MPKKILTRLSFIYLSSYFLLFFIHYAEKSSFSLFIPDQTNFSFFKSKRESLSECFSSSKDPCLELAFSYVLGFTKKLPLKVRKDHRILGLQHLFTPSGIHLTSLLVLFVPLITLAKRKKLWKSLLTVCLCLLIFFLPGLYPLKRLALMRLLLIAFDHFFHFQDVFLIFLLTFFLDFFLGTFLVSPLSFAYSFLFLGIVLSMENHPKIFWPWALLGGYLITAFFNGESQTVLGFILNFFLSSLFEVIYPFLFVGFWIEWCFLIKYPLQFYLKLIQWCSSLAKLSGSYEGTMPLLMLFFIYSCHLPLKKYSLIIFLLLHAENLWNLPRSKNLTSPSMTKEIYSMPPSSAFVSGKFQNKAISLKYKKTLCRVLLKRDIQYVKCRPKKTQLKKEKIFFNH